MDELELNEVDEHADLNQSEIDKLLLASGLGQEIYAKNVLLVDTAKFMRKLQELYLQPKNITVVGEASNGIEAIEQYATLKPDLIIIGIHLPDLDGIQVIKNLIKYDKYAQIIVCSADGRKSTVMKAIEIGAIDYLLKPFTQDRLINNLKDND